MPALKPTERLQPQVKQEVLASESPEAKLAARVAKVLQPPSHAGRPEAHSEKRGEKRVSEPLLDRPAQGPVPTQAVPTQAATTPIIEPAERRQARSVLKPAWEVDVFDVLKRWPTCFLKETSSKTCPTACKKLA